MTFKDKISNLYFQWMYDLACGDRFPEGYSYKKLLMYLHNVEFIPLIPHDENRAADGIDLRYRFALELGNDEEYIDLPNCIFEYLDGPCSVFEMILALAIYCEESIMDDPLIGDRTRQWFWGMLRNLEISTMTDDCFSRMIVEERVMRFLNREYKPDGRGGLFTIRNCSRDLREVEICHQLFWYLDTIT